MAPRAVLTRDDVVDLLASLGQPCQVSTWASYVSRGQAPRPVRYVGRTPLWADVDVREWAATRPRFIAPATNGVTT